MNPYATNVPLKFVNFNISNTQGGLNSNIVWNIAYDSQTNKLWLGTPKGVSMLDTYNGQDLVSLLPSDKEPEQDVFGLGASSFVGLLLFIKLPTLSLIGRFHQASCTRIICPHYIILHQVLSLSHFVTMVS